MICHVYIGSGVFLALTGSLPCASHDRLQPARHPWGALFSSPPPQGLGRLSGHACTCWRPRLSPDPWGPESGSPSSRPACSLSAGERGSPRAWAGSLQWVEQAAGRCSPRGGSALGARPADATRVTAHAGRPHFLGSLMAGSTAQPGCPECPPCWSQHRLCRRKATWNELGEA